MPFLRATRPLLIALVLSSCASKATLDLTKTEMSQVRMDKTQLASDSLSLALISPYKKKIDDELSTVIGYSEQALDKATPEGLLGDFVADACLAQAKELCAKKGYATPDLCFLNNGGLRNALPNGNLTKKHIFELMPFENELVMLEVPAAKVQLLAEFMAKKGGVPVSGIRMLIKNDKADSIEIAGKIYDGKTLVRVITSDYLAAGGDDLVFLAEIKEKYYLDVKVRDAIMNYIIDQKQAGKNIRVNFDGRIQKR